MKRDFTKWFQEKLRVERYPMPGELSKLDVPTGRYHVVNVSDEYIHANNQACYYNKHQAVFHHWFPMNECVGSMGINSLFGALVVLHEAECSDAHVLLHCHAGVNRSQTVADAYYFLRTGRHRGKLTANSKELLINFGHDVSTDELELKQNMLQWNCSTGQLPHLAVTEKFLKLLGTRLEETMDMAACRGSLLTQLKLELNIQ